MVWQLFHMGWPWDAPCEKARLPGWLAAWQGWLAGLAGWLGRAGWAPGLAWLAGLAGLAGWPGLAGLAGWTARKFTDGVTLTFTTVSPRFHHGFTTLKGSVEGYTTTYAGALNTNY